MHTLTKTESYTLAITEHYTMMLRMEPSKELMANHSIKMKALLPWKK